MIISVPMRGMVPMIPSLKATQTLTTPAPSKIHAHPTCFMSQPIRDAQNEQAEAYGLQPADDGERLDLAE